jgi:hypothetical protein
VISGDVREALRDAGITGLEILEANGAPPYAIAV